MSSGWCEKSKRVMYFRKASAWKTSALCDYQHLFRCSARQSYLAASTLEMSFRPTCAVTLSSHASTVSPSTRLATALMAASPIAARILPILGRGLVPGLSRPGGGLSAHGPEPRTSGPLLLLILIEPLERGGSGKREAFCLGDVKMERELERRWMTLGRRRGGVAASGKRLGDGGGRGKRCELATELADGPEEMVDALTRVRRRAIRPEGSGKEGTNAEMDGASGVEVKDAPAMELRGEKEGVSGSKICLSSALRPRSERCESLLGLASAGPASGLPGVRPDQSDPSACGDDKTLPNSSTSAVLCLCSARERSRVALRLNAARMRPMTAELPEFDRDPIFGLDG